MSRLDLKSRMGLLLASLTLLALTLPAFAVAEPHLAVTLAHSPESIPRNNEQMAYRLEVKNEAESNPAPGDHISCVNSSKWSGATSFSFEWRSNGATAAGTVTPTAEGSEYEIAPSDAGHSLQCLVKAINAGGSVVVLTKPIYVEPTPSEPSAPQFGDGGNEASISGAPEAGHILTCVAPAGWDIDATVRTTAGSTQLTNVTTATGGSTGQKNLNPVKAGSAAVQVTSLTSGRFRVGQEATVTSNGTSLFAAGTTIVAVQSHELILSTAAIETAIKSITIKAGSQPLSVVDHISGPGIPAGTTITSTSGRTVTMSAPATASATEAVVTTGMWTFSWLNDGAPVGGAATQQSATSSAYEVQAGDIPGSIECAAVGRTGNGGEGPAPVGGTATSVSIALRTNPAPVPEPPFLLSGSESALPSIASSNTTSGQVTLEFDLPPGEATRINGFGIPGEPAKSPTGWSCSKQEPLGAVPGKLICTRSDALAPQSSYPGIEVLATIGESTVDPAIATASVTGGGSSTATASDEFHFTEPIGFGVPTFTTAVLNAAGVNFTQAGGHPFSAGAEFELSRRVGGEGQVLPIQFLRDLVTDLPPGFVGNPQAAPKLCSGTAAVREDTYKNPKCPRSSIVGIGRLVLGTQSTGSTFVNLPVYAIRPERGAPAQFVLFLPAFGGVVVPITPRLRPSEGYAIRLESPSLAKNPVVFSVGVKLCSYGTKIVEGTYSLEFGPGPSAAGCKTRTESGTEPANPKPFLTNPTRCSGTPPVTKLAIDSWEERGATEADGGPVYSDPRWHTREYASPEVTGCGNVPFEPTIEFEPTTHRAEAPTGLDVTLEVPTDGLESGEIGGQEAVSQSTLKKAVVALPKGMSVNPSSADGLGACTPSQISLGTNLPVQCPESSKIGSAEIETPLLEEPLGGSVYLAKQGSNPFGSLLALYLVAESKERGVLVKIPGKVTPGPDGQLTAEFDENPQLPFKALHLHFNSGNRAPLLNPPSCGTYDVQSKLYPWANPGDAMESTSSFQITEGPNGGPCPGGALEPKLNAGVISPYAAFTSPFTTQVSREEGTQRFDGLDLRLPPGLSAYLTGIPYCSDQALASVSEAEGSGRAEIEHPSCPAASEIGTVTVGAGGGPYPYYVDTGRAYLAGPYKGAPLSIAVVAPAVAGPFDLGSVVVRNAAYVNEGTAQITVKSDPIPTALHGIPLDIRDIRIDVNRPHFTLSPSSCEVMSIDAQVSGEAGGDASASNRFQVGGCDKLGFKPDLKLEFKGGTTRTRHPMLKSVLTFPTKGRFANVASAAVTLPHSEIIDQDHVGNPCTRPQFAEEKCPKISILGRAKAWSPLLDEPLEGKVYFRSNGGERLLPDVVADLRGQIHVVLIGAVDTVTPKTNPRIRTTFFQVPDAPVSRFELQLKGGREGLLVNSENLCKSNQHAVVNFTAQNGLVQKSQPVIANRCGKGGKSKSRGKQARHPGRPHT